MVTTVSVRLALPLTRRELPVTKRTESNVWSHTGPYQTVANSYK